MINQKDKGAQQGRKVAKPSKRKLYQYLVDQYVESIYRYDEDICRIDNFLNIPLEKHAKSLDKQFRILSEIHRCKNAASRDRCCQHRYS